MNILEALDHTQLFRRWFDAPTWEAWRAFLAALFALPMSEQQLGIYRDCTKRTAEPAKAFNEAWLVCAGRAGKSSILALTAVFLAFVKNYKPYLAPGEVATIRVMAADRAQARTILAVAEESAILCMTLLSQIDARTASQAARFRSARTDWPGRRWRSHRLLTARCFRRPAVVMNRNGSPQSAHLV